MQINPVAPDDKTEVYDMSLFDRFFTKTRTAVLHITSANGFHLRPAAVFVKEAKRFSSTIEAETRGESVNAKNLNTLLSLNLENGDHFDLVCKGKDAQEALEHLTQTFEQLMCNDKEIATTQKEAHHYEGMSLEGQIVAQGIAIAPLWHYQEKTIATEDHTTFKEAVEKSLRTLETLTKKHDASADGDIYMAQKALLEGLLEECNTIEEFVTAVSKESNALRGGKMEAKIIDYKDILRCVRGHMGYETTALFPDHPFILISDDLLPSQVETLPSHTAGVVLHETSLTSHTAILLRASGISSLIIRTDIPASEQNVILDAHSGILILQPTEADLKKAKQRQEADKETERNATDKRFAPAVTTNGKHMKVLANVTDVASAKQAKEAGAEGVGLLRTEFLFKEEAPSFEAQKDAYTAIFSLFDDVTVRTLDVGGDKSLPYIDLPKENNPFLGIRGIRLFKTHPQVIETQLRAVFEAANGKEIKVMFPMVATVEEFAEAKTFAKEVAAKYDIDISNVHFGIMVEIPSVLFLMQAFNKVVDFYSIGTNDLNQYLFAIERTHPSLSLNPRSEVLFNTIEQVVKESNKPVSICGELAGDTEATTRLVNMGIETLSLSPKRIATLKETIRHV